MIKDNSEIIGISETSSSEGTENIYNIENENIVENKVVIKKRERNYGIDLLKIFSMFYVVTIHVIDGGGILKSCEKNEPTRYYIAKYIHNLAFCAVNCFGMVSGYLIVNSKNCSKLKAIPLWLNVFYYTVPTTLLFRFVPYLSNLFPVSNKNLFRSFFPATSKQYWYYTSYFVMFFFIPYINKILHSLTKKEYKTLCNVLFVLFSVLPMLVSYEDTFTIGKGFSPWWLAALYIFGGYFRMYPVNVSKLLCFIVYIVSTTLTFIPKYLSYNNPSFKAIDIFQVYNSIFTVFSSTALLLIFIKIEVKNQILQKIIERASSVSFSVYIIHFNEKIYHSFIRFKFGTLKQHSPPIFAIRIFLHVIAIYVVCSLFDLIRFYIFKALKVDEIPKRLSNIKLFSKSNSEEESRNLVKSKERLVL